MDLPSPLGTANERRGFDDTIVTHQMSPLREVLHVLVRYPLHAVCARHPLGTAPPGNASRHKYLGQRDAALHRPGHRELPLPSMAAFMQRLPAKFAAKPRRRTDGAVFRGVECSATVTLSRSEKKLACLVSVSASILFYRRGTLRRCCRKLVACC